MHIDPPRNALIDTPSAATRALASLADSPWLALDTEFVRERTYYPQLCLLQMASDEANFCFDLLALVDLVPLREFLTGAPAVKIFHAARQDLEALVRIGAGDLQPLFDTQIAASLLGHPEQVSYAWLVQHYCGVMLDKSQTRTDWSQRPLSAAQLTYAHADVQYLGELHTGLLRDLKAAGKVDWVVEECARIAGAVTRAADPIEAWRRVRGINGLSFADAVIACALAIWREKIAQQSDRPREWIVKDSVLLQLATLKPRDLVGLSQVAGISPGIVRRHGAELLELLQHPAPPDNLPSSLGTRLSPAGQALLTALMATVKARALAVNLEPSVLASRKDLEALIFETGAQKLTQGWRAQLVGDELRTRIAEVPLSTRLVPVG